MILQRHTLCYLKPDAKPLSTDAQHDPALLRYWNNQKFPLIYTHQPHYLGLNQVKLAIPFVELATKKKIRMSYLFSQTSISYSTQLPKLTAVFPDSVLETSASLYVYGSYCWQHITQHPYVHATSDLDVQILYASESLRELTELYSMLLNALPIKSLDGEVSFADIGDCSWLELIQASSCDSILFKSEHQIRLVPREQLYAIFPTLLANP